VDTFWSHSGSGFSEILEYGRISHAGSKCVNRYYTLNVLLGPKVTQLDGFSEVFIEIWRQALVDKSDFVKIDSRRYPIVTLKAKHLRQVTLEFEGKSIIGIEQNSNTTSRWAQMARSGLKVMQFVLDGRYAANVADGKVTLYGKRVSEQKA
jgi:hypothetical protein